ncbi:hypothetical protein HaLaN_26408 [Haematococcus lacustris]|uniref:Uncharacterized protein n=1 Tax=Haematococcus lacustris TaxID=44745 RepID=A0A6A0A658_HAELA|nr:hypothetical protein HaLaN_26408 [Haematococcus lacustris]
MLCFLYGDALVSEANTDTRSQFVHSASNQQQVQQVQQSFANLSTVPQQNVAAHGVQAAKHQNTAALGAPTAQQPNNAAIGAGQQNAAASVSQFSFTPIAEVAAATTVVAAAEPGEAKTAAINAFTSSAQQLLNASGRLHAIEPVNRVESADMHVESTQVARSNVGVTLPVLKKWGSKDLLGGQRL